MAILHHMEPLITKTEKNVNNRLSSTILVKYSSKLRVFSVPSLGLDTRYRSLWTANSNTAIKNGEDSIDDPQMLGID